MDNEKLALELDAIYSRGINGVDWKKISEK